MNNTNKPYGRLSLNELKSYITLFTQLQSEYNELEKELETKEILGPMDPPYCWANLYSTTFTELINAFTAVTGQTPIIQNIANSANPQQSALDYSAQVNLSDSDMPGDLKTILLLLNAVSKNLVAISTLHHSLCEIVELIPLNPQSPLFFKAIKIDRTIINNPVYADQIALAAFRHDKKFFSKLSNALKSTGINKRDEEYDSLRFALYLLEVEEKVLSDLTQVQAYQLFCIDLEVYPDDGDAPKLWQFISRWKKSRST